MSNCTICLDALLEDLQVATKCGHVFHTKCINQWLSTRKTCPLCHVKTTKSKLCKLYISHPGDGALKSLQEETRELQEKVKLLQTVNDQKQRLLEHKEMELKQQKVTTTSYIQKNIELDEDREELKEQISHLSDLTQCKDQEIATLKQQIETLRNKAKNGIDSSIGRQSLLSADHGILCLGISQISRSRKRKRSAIDLSVTDDEEEEEEEDSDVPRRRRSARRLQGKRKRQQNNVEQSDCDSLSETSVYSANDTEDEEEEESSDDSSEYSPRNRRRASRPKRKRRKVAR